MESNPPPRFDVGTYMKYDALERIAFVDIETNGLLKVLRDKI
jgi:hypothetical protein